MKKAYLAALDFARRNSGKLMTAAALATTSVTAHAQTATVTGIVDDAGGLLTSIYPIVIGAVSFGILVSLVKLVRRK